MNSYLRQLSFGEIIRGCFDIYLHHFFTILIIYALPVFPISYISNLVFAQGEWALYLVLVIISFLLGSLAYAAITITLSDICLGSKPGIIRSYRYVFGPVIWKLVATNLVQSLIIMIGLVLAVVPGLIFTIWLMFVSIIVVLENTWGRDAFKRSKSLGKDYYLRNAGLFLFVILFNFLFGEGVQALFEIINYGQLSIALAIGVPILVQPIVLIMLVLTYYDLRARKEGYDSAALAEDLQH